MTDDAKYAAACSETVARIQARDEVIKGFVALAAALVALSMSKDELALLGVSVGYTALAASFLSRHHDVIIGLLGAFQDQLCANNESRLNWFSDDYFHSVLRERGYRDICLFLVLAGGGIFGLGVAKKAVALCQLEMKTGIWYSGLACLIGSFVIVGWTYLTRRALHRRMHPHHEN